MKPKFQTFSIKLFCLYSQKVLFFQNPRRKDITSFVIYYVRDWKNFEDSLKCLVTLNIREMIGVGGGCQKDIWP